MLSHRPYIYIINIIFLFSQSLLLLGQTEIDSLTSNKIYTLEDITLTANHFSMPVSQTGKVVHIISEKTLEFNKGKTISELLNTQSGIQIIGAGSNFGAVKSLNLRGANNSQTLILIDGIPIYDPTGIGSAFEIRLLHPSTFSKIEILKGSQSTLYGSDAVAGVINFISKESDYSKIKAGGSFLVGNYDVQQMQVYGNFPITKKIATIINVSNFSSNGISEAKDTMQALNFEKDLMSQLNFNIKVDANITSNLSFAPFLRQNNFYGYYDAGSFLDNTDNTYEINVLQTGYSLSYKKKKIELKNQFSHQRTNRVFEDKSIYTPENYSGTTNWGNLALQYSTNTWLTVVANIEYRTHSYEDIEFQQYDENYNLTNTTDSAYYFNQYSSSINTFFHWNNKYFLELGTRGNFSSSYDPQLTYNARLSYLWNQKNTKLFLGASSAFKTPSLYQLYSQYGNRQLQPEKSWTYELGIKTTLYKNKLDLSLVTFLLQSQDVINYISTQYINYDNQNNKGIEIDFKYTPTKNWLIQGNYSFVEGELTTKNKTQTKDTSYANLYKIGSHKMNISAIYSIRDIIHIGADMNFVSSRNDITFDASFNSVPVNLDPYFLLNMYADTKIFTYKETHCILFANIKNITNTDYQETFGYSTLGTNFVIGIKVTFNP